MSRLGMLCVVGTLCTLVFAAPSVGAVFVRPGGSDANNGSSWSQAKASVQAGIDAASAGGGGEVWVAAGKYVGCVVIPPGTSIYGGFAGTETSKTQRDWKRHVTTLDGNRSGSVVTIAPLATASTVVDGFTITNGSGAVLTDTVTSCRGGGIYCIDGSPTISNNTISGNKLDAEDGEAYGGGIYTDGACLIVHNLIVGNKVTGSGGRPIYGAGVSAVGPAMISGNEITGNAVYSPTVVFSGSGAAIHCADSATIINNRIAGNSSGDGAVFCGSCLVANNVIWANRASGIWLYDSSTATVVNNTIVGNSEGGILGWADLRPTIANNIIAFNRRHGIGIVVPPATATLSDNCVYGNSLGDYSGISPGVGDITVDPKLAGVAYGNLHIQPNSPCRGAGSNSFAPSGLVDMDGQARIQGTNVDIGADESNGTTWTGIPKVVRVKPDGSDSNDGSSWTLAKRTVAGAIASLAGKGGRVWVKAGQYNENIAIPMGVYVYGGFVGNETATSQRNWLTNATALSAQTGIIAELDYGYQVSCIDGFTIGPGGSTGVYLDFSSATVANNHIMGNGTGVDCFRSGPSITGNNVSGNGRGIMCDGSTAYIGFNTIADNNCSENGAGLYLHWSDGTTWVVNNIIRGNHAAGFGGGIYCASAYGPIVGNLIADNTSDTCGGGIYVIVYPDTLTWLGNNTIVHNAAPDGGGVASYGSFVDMMNNIVAFNSSGLYSEWDIYGGSNCVFGNNDYDFRGTYDQSRWILQDPLFVDRLSGNYHLQPASPCVDTGDNRAVLDNSIDMDGQARIYGGTVDIGADEWMPAAPANTSVSPNTGSVPVNTKIALTTKHSDPEGFENLQHCYLLLNKSLSEVAAAEFRYNANTNRLYVRNDAGTGWTGGYAPGSSSAIENSYCRLYCAETTKSGSGETLTIIWKILLKPVTSGSTCGAWMQSVDDGGLKDAWEKMGSLNIGQAATNQAPVDVSLSPSSGTLTSGSKLTFTTKYSDADGFANLSGCYLLFNDTLSTKYGAYFRYDSNANKLHIRNDSDTAWSGGYAPGASNVIENSFCKLYCAETTTSASGTTRTVNWKITLKPITAGSACSAWMCVYDDGGLKDGWDRMGGYSIR